MYNIGKTYRIVFLNCHSRKAKIVPKKVGRNLIEIPVF